MKENNEMWKKQLFKGMSKPTVSFLFPYSDPLLLFYLYFFLETEMSF